MATKYLILQRGVDRGWLECARLEAASAEAAIRSHAATLDAGATFAAVPERSFTELTVQIENVPRVRIVGAGNAAPAHPRGAGKDGDE